MQYVKYRSLQPLLKIIASERCYKVQIISLEPFSTLIELFNYRDIKYKLILTAADTPDVGRLNIIIGDAPAEDLEPGPYVLYSNIANMAFVQIVFDVSMEEKIRYFTLKHGPDSKKVVMAHGKSKTVSDMEGMLRKRMSTVPYPRVNYIETLILLCSKGKSFDKIWREVGQMDSKLKNKFLVWLTLNGLVERNLVTRTGNSFRSGISRESLDGACRRIGVDVSLFR